mmetsp:Transcript_17856/g.30308  ORF Transcript_17856/g.30308 Transcript_17856/m.30308 type:complete len:89 (-) Transcript_17856:234-500(-)
MHMHKIVNKHGEEAAREVRDVFEFDVQLDNGKPLKVNKNAGVEGEDFVIFTIDLKNERGKVYVGGFEQDHHEREEEKRIRPQKPSVVF